MVPEKTNQPRSTDGDMPPENELPIMVILLAAYNEAITITQRIENLLALDYPTQRLLVYIGTDGCTDATAHLARQAATPYPWIRIMEFNQNRGKTSVLRRLAHHVAEDLADVAYLLVFTDANTSFQPDVLRRLSRHFEQPQTGGVCGRLMLTGHASSESTYWNLENKLKAAESRLDSCLGANGAIYAIRPDCFPKTLPENTIVDDFVIGMHVRTTGQRMRFDEEILATEPLPELEDEWRRRVRIGTGDYQALLLCKNCLHPRFGWFAWCFWSHKVLRWFTPHLLTLMILGTTFTVLVPFAMDWQISRFHRATAFLSATGVIFLVLAASAGQWVFTEPRTRTLTAKLCRGATHFVIMQTALLTGFCHFCKGNVSGTWQSTPRGSYET